MGVKPTYWLAKQQITSLQTNMSTVFMWQNKIECYISHISPHRAECTPRLTILIVYIKHVYRWMPHWFTPKFALLKQIRHKSSINLWIHYDSLVVNQSPISILQFTDTYWLGQRSINTCQHRVKTHTNVYNIICKHAFYYAARSKLIKAHTSSDMLPHAHKC